jgi:hypothetical protein
MHRANPPVQAVSDRRQRGGSFCDLHRGMFPFFVDFQSGGGYTSVVGGWGECLSWLALAMSWVIKGLVLQSTGVPQSSPRHPTVTSRRSEIRAAELALDWAVASPPTELNASRSPTNPGNASQRPGRSYPSGWGSTKRTLRDTLTWASKSSAGRPRGDMTGNGGGLPTRGLHVRSPFRA